MSISTRIRRDISNIINKHGNTIIIYDPTISFNVEGDPVYILDAGVSTLSAVFTLDPEEMKYKVEGIDLNNSYMCYIEYDQTIDKDTIYYQGAYYKVFSFAKIFESDDSCFYNIIISSAGLKFAKRSTYYSNARIV
jgi:hypothetical protein